MVLGGLAFAVPPWLVKEAIPQLNSIQHVRHGLLDFSMQHDTVVIYGKAWFEEGDIILRDSINVIFK